MWRWRQLRGCLWSSMIITLTKYDFFFHRATLYQWQCISCPPASAFRYLKNLQHLETVSQQAAVMNCTSGSSWPTHLYYDENVLSELHMKSIMHIANDEDSQLVQCREGAGLLPRCSAEPTWWTHGHHWRPHACSSAAFVDHSLHVLASVSII